MKGFAGNVQKQSTLATTPAVGTTGRHAFTSRAPNMHNKFSSNASSLSSKRQITQKTICNSTSTTPATSSDAPAAGTDGFTYTSYEGNSWKVDFASSGVKVLVDPWLVDTLTFGGLNFIYEGTKRVTKPETIDIDALMANTDFILISMSIDDHAHKPTLEVLPKNKLIVGSPSACAVVRKMGFTNVTEVDHGQTVTVADGRMTIRGTEGALVGPPWSKRELGFTLKESTPNGISLYYEPHCDYTPASVATAGQVDVVVTPPSTQSLLGYDLVKGATDNVALLRILRPKVVVPLMNAEFDATGPLHKMIFEVGGPKELEAAIEGDEVLRGMRVCLPKAGQPMCVSL